MRHYKTSHGCRIVLRHPGMIAAFLVSCVGAFAAEPDVVQMDFPNSDVLMVLDYYERLTGRKVWLSTEATTTDAKVNLITEKPVPRAEAIRLLRLTLLESAGLEIRETDKTPL